MLFEETRMGLRANRDDKGHYFQWGKKGNRYYYKPSDEKLLIEKAKEKALLQGYVITNGSMKDFPDDEGEAMPTKIFSSNVLPFKTVESQLDILKDLSLEEIRDNIEKIDLNDSVSNPEMVRMINLFKKYFDKFGQKLD